MQRKPPKPTSIPAFYYGVAIPKAALGDVLETMMLNGCEFDDIKPLFNFRPAEQIAEEQTRKLLPPPAKIESGPGVRGGKMAKVVMKALHAAYPGTITRPDLKRAFQRAKLRPESCSTTLHYLKQEGRVEFVGGGTYRLIPRPAATGENAHGSAT